MKIYTLLITSLFSPALMAAVNCLPVEISTLQHTSFEMTDEARAQGIIELLNANTKFTGLINGGLVEYGPNKELVYNPQSKKRAFESQEQLNRLKNEHDRKEQARADSLSKPGILTPVSPTSKTPFFKPNEYSVVSVKRGTFDIEIINTCPGCRSDQRTMVIRVGEYLMLMELYNSSMRMNNSKIVRIDSSGRIVGTIDKNTFLLDLYPHEEVVLTRTMTVGEYGKWKNPMTPGENFGSRHMSRILGTREKHLSTASSGFWNDALVFWQREIAFKVPKSVVKKWLEEKAAYITPFGFDYLSTARLDLDISVPLPFELASMSPQVNKYMLNAYHRSNTDPVVSDYLKAARENRRFLYPLSFFDPGLSFARGVFYRFLRNPKFMGESLSHTFQARVADVIAMRNSAEKRNEILSVVKQFLEVAAPKIEEHLNQTDQRGNNKETDKVKSKLRALRKWYSKALSINDLPQRPI